MAVAVLSGVVASGLALPLAAGAGAAAHAQDGVLAAVPDDLIDRPLPQTSVLLTGRGTPLAYFYDENRTPVPLSGMSPFVQQAVVAVEDARFFTHGGVDPRGVARAAVSNLSGGDREGASTLTQQYVKNLLLEKATSDGDSAAAQAAVAPTIGRKLREMRLAIALEQRLTKQQILEGYLNIVYFGRQTYGVEAAAQRYFGVPAARLTLAQAATLAAMARNAAAYDPISHPAQAKARRDLVLRAMLDQQLISPTDQRAAVATPMTTKPVALPNGCATSADYGYFCDYVLRLLQSDPGFRELGATAQERLATIRRGGLVIRTTMDEKTQEAAIAAVSDGVSPTDPSGLGVAAVTVQPGTGAVLAMAQNRSFTGSGPGHTSVNYGVDGTLGGSLGFQPGSTFKAFTLAAWLSDGNSLDDVVDATPRSFDDFASCGKRLRLSEPYRPGNSEGRETGELSVAQATADSVNVAYVDMESRLDLCTIATTAGNLGVHLATPQRICAADDAPTSVVPACLPSLTLGVTPVAPLTMAAAYAGFASGGTFCAPRPISTISRAGPRPGSGVEVGVPGPGCTQALSRDVASGVNQALARVLTDGTAARTGPLDPWPSAGKTGTTDGPYDTWFVGYTAQRSTAVWVGDPGSGTGQARQRLTDLEVGGHWYSVIYGASIAAPVWKELMSRAQEGLPSTDLP